MNEVKKCSISGIAFTLDNDAYETLTGYLESLNQTYKETDDGAEIVADIEARIAELILSTQDNTRVVERPLIDNIIKQLGSAEDISSEDPDNDLRHEEPRIPRRLYRDMENAKLGGVCAGIGKYFDSDPVWIRLAMFIPLLFACFGWVPFLGWTGPMMGNLFGIFLICYVIMWFAVPAARTARQKLEMNGERITAQSIGQQTAATAAATPDPDSKARPIVAEAVSVFGKIILFVLKLFAGLIVLGLILSACGLIIGLFAVGIGGEELLSAGCTVAIAVLGIVVGLIFVLLLIYVLMCLIASRKPNGKVVLAIFLLWLVSICILSVVAIKHHVGNRIRETKIKAEQIMQSPVVIDRDTTTLEEMIEKFKTESILDESGKQVRISVPEKSINITVDKESGSLKITSDDGTASIEASEAENGSVKIQLNQNAKPDGEAHSGSDGTKE